MTEIDAFETHGNVACLSSGTKCVMKHNPFGAVVDSRSTPGSEWIHFPLTVARLLQSRPVGMKGITVRFASGKGARIIGLQVQHDDNLVLGPVNDLDLYGEAQHTERLYLERHLSAEYGVGISLLVTFPNNDSWITISSVGLFNLTGVE